VPERLVRSTALPFRIVRSPAYMGWFGISQHRRMKMQSIRHHEDRASRVLDVHKLTFRPCGMHRHAMRVTCLRRLVERRFHQRPPFPSGTRQRANKKAPPCKDKKRPSAIALIFPAAAGGS
jgi:hypothetical protein